MRIKKGDKVKILCGKDRGKTGKIIRMMPSKGKLIVENINLVKKHKKSRKAGEQSERMTLAAPINISNVMLVCPKCSKASRMRSKTIDNKAVRVCQKCEAEIQ